MLANGKLEIKIAIRTYKAGVGIYHKKIGIFKEEFDNVIATNDSSNETNYDI